MNMRNIDSDFTAKVHPGHLETLGWEFEHVGAWGADDYVLFWPGAGGMCYTLVQDGTEGITLTCDLAGALVDLDVLAGRGVVIRC